MRKICITVAACLLAAACNRGESKEGPPPTPPTPPGAPAAPAPVEGMAKIDPNAILERIKVLASDEFEGRAPGTKGEDLTVTYLVDESKKIGLKPGNPDGTYVQKVPLVGITGAEEQPLTVTRGAEKRTFKWADEVVPWTRRVTDRSSIDNSDIIFVGYGVEAPEYNWNDFKNVDVKGKTIVVLVNDPQVPAPGDAAKLDDKLFNGKAMTYYGRWTYKYEKLSEKGAAAAIIIHQTGPAGYPWEVVSGSWGQENLDIPGPGAASRVLVEGWITEAKARELFLASGRDFDGVTLHAATKEFTPLPLLGATASWRVKNTIRRIQSRNVIAKLEGSDPVLKDEYLLYSAHWDHFGKNPSLQGDQILNGALDNASGVAQMLEIAKAFTKLATKPKRSVLFLAVTAEEAGLLGAKYYATHPLYPLERTLANINIDGANQWGRTSDVVVVGLGNSTLDEVLDSIVTASGRSIVPDPESEKGFFYRSDHFEFAKEGVPALYADAGVNYVGKPAGWGLQKRAEYTANDYHKPTHEAKPDWDLSGAVEHGQMLFEVGYRVAQSSVWPKWKPGTEFKAKREAMLTKEK